MNPPNVCIFCHTNPKNGFGDGCCLTCVKTGGHSHGWSCASNLSNRQTSATETQNFNSLCTFCQQYPKNNSGDGCCRTCAKTKGGAHGPTCASSVNALTLKMCVFCHKYPKNDFGDGCCGTCARTKGKSHGQSCDGNQIIINFYNSNQPYYEFTNFYSVPITMAVNGEQKQFPTSEHYFQFMKYVNTPNWKHHYDTICSNQSPRHAFDYGRSNKYDYKFYDKIKDQIMYDAVLAKFTQNPQLGTLLKSTLNAKLVEHTSNDSYWGDGGDGSGKNKLGKILEMVRGQI